MPKPPAAPPKISQKAPPKVPQKLPPKIPQKILARQHEIVTDYRRAVDAHLADVVSVRATEMLEIRDFAAQLCIHPTHLSNVLRHATGHPPCHYFEAQILAAAQHLLTETTRPAADIAANLTYDPSNFGKFFKHFTGLTPKQYREQAWAERRAAAL